MYDDGISSHNDDTFHDCDECQYKTASISNHRGLLKKTHSLRRSPKSSETDKVNMAPLKMRWN